jgi:hypothetical protein
MTSTTVRIHAPGNSWAAGALFAADGFRRQACTVLLAS